MHNPIGGKIKEKLKNTKNQRNVWHGENGMKKIKI